MVLRTGRKLSAILLILLAAFALALTPALAASAHDESEEIRLTNQARYENGQAGLIENSSLDSVALAWAQQLAANNVLSHNPNYSSQIPSGWTVAGENVARGYPSAQGVHDAWMASPGHRENILGDYTDIGVALFDGAGTTWAVQVFAKYPGHVGPQGPFLGAEPAAPAPVQPAVEPSETPTPTPEPVVVTPTPTPTAPVPTPTATRTAAPLPVAERATPTLAGAELASESVVPAQTVALTFGVLLVLLVGVLALVPSARRWWLSSVLKRSSPH